MKRGGFIHVGLLVLPETPNATRAVISATLPPKASRASRQKTRRLKPRSEAPPLKTVAGAAWRKVQEMKEHPLMESATESQHALVYNVAGDKVWQRRRTLACCRTTVQTRM